MSISGLQEAIMNGLTLFVSSSNNIMHGKEDANGSLMGESIPKETEEGALNAFNESNEVKSAYVEMDVNITNVAKTATHTREAAESSVTEKFGSEVVQQHVSQSNDDDKIEEIDDKYFNAESREQYNVLVNQYNAVEEERQKVLEQLYLYGNWDYQGSGYDSQYQTVPAPQTCSCLPFVCPYSTAPADDCFIKAAMGAVDKAIHVFSKETSGIPDVDQEGKKEQQVETMSHTDLSVVLNAWFSAGFYTGKYLSEQASTKK